MLAAVKTENVQEVVVREVAKPVLLPGEVLIKVDYCGVCGSDLHAYNHSKGYEFVKKPIVLGHELSGTVVETYDTENQSLIGKKVIVESMNFCGECENCKKGNYSICDNIKVLGLHFDGGMAQYVKVKEKFVKEINVNISSKLAALTEPMSIAVHAVDAIAKVGFNDLVFVQGPGIIGFFVSLVCKIRGANVILAGLEKDYENRLSKCGKFGIQPFISGRDKLNGMVDIFFECSGASNGVESGLKTLKKGGKAIIVALYEHPTTIFLTPFVRNEIQILTSYGSNPEEYEESMKILEHYGDSLNQLISIYPLQKTDSAFKDGLNQKVLKPLINIKDSFKE
jgi:L-iditol 2-dehydrogenase